MYSVEADGIDTRIELGDGCPHRRLKPQNGDLHASSLAMAGVRFVLLIVVLYRRGKTKTKNRKDKKVIL